MWGFVFNLLSAYVCRNALLRGGGQDWTGALLGVVPVTGSTGELRR